jgi:glycosyltransferase involved in cell wall biosynthesis
LQDNVYGNDRKELRISMATATQHPLDQSETTNLNSVQCTTVSAAGTVDIVIPCYNYARYLRACVQSVLSQENVSVRVLIIDDASSDETPEIGLDIAASHKQVEFRRHQVNQGHIATYNEGLIGWSTSEYCMLLSADDLLAPGALSRAVRIMEADKSIGMVYGRTIHFFDESELPLAQTDDYGHIRYSGAEWAAGRCRSGVNVITSPEVVMRGAIQREVGGYRPELPHAGDLEMWLRVASKSNIGFVRGPAQAYYRVHQGSMQRTRFQSKLSDFVQRKAAFDSFFLYHIDTTGKAFRMHDLANRALAREALWDVCRAYDHGQVDPVRVNELVEFAIKSYPKATSLREYSALRRRRFLGPKLCKRTQVFVVPASGRWLIRWFRKLRWQRVGI